MRAAQYSRYGGPDVLGVAEVAVPTPDAGRAVVRVEGTSVNQLDKAARSGQLRLALGWRFPKGTGLDVLGTVDSVGRGWSGPPVGTRVWGFKPNLPSGRTLAAAEYWQVAPGWIAEAPDGDADLAALPLVGATVLGAFDRLALRSGRRLLVRGAAGGVGSVAVALGKHLGAHVTAVCSARDTEFVRELGADEVVDRDTAPADIDARFDAILDVVGTGLFAWRRLLTPSGRMLTTATSGAAAIIGSVVFGPRRIRTIIVSPDPAILGRLAAAVTAGGLAPIVGARFPLDAIAEAHAASVRGKVVVTVREDAAG